MESLEDAAGACAYRATIVENAAYRSILVMHHLLRLTVLRLRGPTESSSAPASALAVSVLLGRSVPPFPRIDGEPTGSGGSRP
jgi:hypothetical protein